MCNKRNKSDWFLNEEWPSDLCWKNIQAVPSYHFTPIYAHIVRTRMVRYTPDIVAVELPDNLGDTLETCISQLPELGAILTSSHSTIPIAPEDSICEAIRSAYERGLSLHLVDLDVLDKSHQKSSLADGSLAEEVNISEIIEMNSSSSGDLTTNTAFLQREEHMAHHLQHISEENQDKTILFVCGMSHWKRIKARLDIPNKLYEHQSSMGSRTSAITGSDYHILTGAKPFRCQEYESGRSSTKFSYKGWLSELFLESAKSCNKTLNITELQNLLNFSRNQAIVAGELEGTFENILDASEAIVDIDYRNEVFKTLFKYTYNKKDQKNNFRVIKCKNDYLLCDCFGNQFPVKPYWSSDIALLETQEQSKLPKRLKERKHPNKDVEGSVIDSDWGRYTDEMEEEERFLNSLEQYYLRSKTGIDHQVHEFSGGFLDGIDIKETLRYRFSNKWYVKESLNDEPRFAMILVEFDDEPSKNTYDIFTYGCHKALAFCTAPQNPEGTAYTDKLEFGTILSFKRIIDFNQLYEIYKFMCELRKQGKSPHEVLCKIAFESSNFGDILVVAPRKSLIDYKKRASEQNIQIHTLAKEDIWNPTYENIKTFNIYYHVYD